MCAVAIRPPTSSPEAPVSLPPLCWYLSATTPSSWFQVHFSSPQGTPACAWHSITEHNPPTWLWRKWEKEKQKGKLRQLTSSFICFFNMFCLQVCQSLKFEQEAVREDCAESCGSPCSMEWKVRAPTRRIVLYGLDLFRFCTCPLY